MAEFTHITISEVREVLRAEKGWAEVNVPGVNEYVLQWPLKAAPHIVLRVYTSIVKGELYNRGVGRDAIRVCAVDLNTGFGYIKSRRVHRVKGWRENLKTRCLETLKAARERLGPVPAPKNDTVSSLSFPKFKTKKSRREWFRDCLAKNRAAAYDALLAIYERQTEDEKCSQATVEDNGIGFSGVDAELLSSFAEQLTKRREMQGPTACLSPKQDALLFKKMRKYAGQYVDVLASRGVKTLEEKNPCH